MKRLFAILLILGFLSGNAFAYTWAYTRTGVTTVGINKMTWGTFTDAQTGANDIITGLSTVRAFGVNINSSASIASPLKTTVSAGTISVTSVSDGPDGLWWAIGR